MNEHWIFHPDDTVLKDEAWLLKQPAGTVATIIMPKQDAYIGTPELALGEGRGGKNAIRFRTTGQSTTGIGSFWMIPQATNGFARENPSSDAALVIPPAKKVNRMECWMRFPPGFRKSQSPNSRMFTNFQWGTYTARPAGTGGDLTLAAEMSPWDGIIHGTSNSTGWHFYHEAIVRHDLTGDNEWVRVVFHGAPSHLRGDGGRNIQAMDPTQPHGDYFSCLTRSYIDIVPYWWNFRSGTDAGGNPEIAAPFDIYCDSIRFFWHDAYQPCEIRFGPAGDWLEGQEIEISSAPVVNDIPFRITNTSNAKVSGRLAWRGRFEYGVSIVPQPGGQGFNWQLITLNPGETKNYWLRLSPSENDNSVAPDYPNQIGIVFEPDSEYVGVEAADVDGIWGKSRRSKWSGDRVESHAISGVGGNDLDICYRSITFLKNGGRNTSYRPTSIGGAKYRASSKGTTHFQLPGHIPDGSPITFTKIKSQAGRGSLSISPSGLVTYSPPSDGWTGTCHFSYQLTGEKAKPSVYYGAWVDVTADTPPVVDPPPVDPPPVDPPDEPTEEPNVKVTTGKLTLSLWWRLEEKE